jgi:hypothetical protein
MLLELGVFASVDLFLSPLVLSTSCLELELPTTAIFFEYACNRVTLEWSSTTRRCDGRNPGTSIGSIMCTDDGRAWELNQPLLPGYLSTCCFAGIPS